MRQDGIEHAMHTARLRWPSIQVAEGAYRAYVAGRAGGHHLVDLYLACGCAAGDPSALAVFEAEILVGLPSMLARFDAQVVAEARSVLYERLLTGAVPGIGTYGGTAELRNWVRVVANRIALDLLRRTGTHALASDDALATVADASDDPQLAYLKATYRAELAQSFREALRSLTPKQRNLLRFQVLDRLTSDEVGAFYGVHRATAARWIERARDTLIARTRKRLLARLRVDSVELESILRLVRSRVDISLTQLLGSEEVARLET